MRLLLHHSRYVREEKTKDHCTALSFLQTARIGLPILFVERREIRLHPLPEDIPHGLLVRCGLHAPSSLVLVIAIHAPSLASPRVVSSASGTHQRTDGTRDSGPRVIHSRSRTGLTYFDCRVYRYLIVSYP